MCETTPALGLVLEIDMDTIATKFIRAGHHRQCVAAACAAALAVRGRGRCWCASPLPVVAAAGHGCACPCSWWPLAVARCGRAQLLSRRSDGRRERGSAEQIIFRLFIKKLRIKKYNVFVSVFFS